MSFYYSPAAVFSPPHGLSRLILPEALGRVRLFSSLTDEGTCRERLAGCPGSHSRGLC